ADPRLILTIVGGCGQEHANAPHPLALLRHSRPRRRRAAEQRDELAAPDHSITSSARSRIDVGSVRPMAFAALRLTMTVNRLERSTGRSPGFVPLRILSTNVAAR